MLSGVNIFCFTASYTVVLLLELLRLSGPSKWRDYARHGFAIAGVVAHTIYLAVRAVASDASPLSSPYDWCLLAAWLLAMLYILFSFGNRKAPFGIFLLPLVLILIGAAHFFADQQPFAPGRASRTWGTIHGVFLLLGTVSVLVGFAAGVMYLVQSYRLKHKMLPREGFRLPSLESLEKVNGQSLFTSVLFIGIGFLSGLILNLIKHLEDPSYLPWNDSVVLSSAAMFLWLVLAALFNLVYPAARRGRKVSYLTVASFVFLVFVMGSLLLSPTHHGSGSQANSPPGAANASHHWHTPWPLEREPVAPHCLHAWCHISQTAAANGPNRIVNNVLCSQDLLLHFQPRGAV